MCLEYDVCAREMEKSGLEAFWKAWDNKKKLKIMRDALVSVTCCMDIQEAAAIANKAMIDCDAIVQPEREQK